MGQDKDHDFLTDLMAWCNKLSTTGHESFIITTNLEHRKMYLSGSKIGKMFLSQEREICNRFFKFCQDIYASEAAISLSKEAVSSLSSRSQDDQDSLLQNGHDLNSDSKDEQKLSCELQDKLRKNLAEKARENVGFVDDSKVFRTSLFDPDVASNIKQEKDDISDFIGAHSITETEFLGLQINTSANHEMLSQLEIATTNDLEDIGFSQNSQDSGDSQSGSDNDGDTSETFMITVNSGFNEEEFNNEFSSSTKTRRKRKTAGPMRRAAAFEPEFVDKATEKINPALVDPQIKNLLRIKLKKDPLPDRPCNSDDNERNLRSKDNHLPKMVYKGSRKMYQCKLCDIKLCSMSSFKRHFLLHDKRGKQQVCRVCGKKFLRKEDVKKHEEAVHFTRSKDFTCPVCAMKLKTYNSLKTHVRRIHNQDVYSMKNPDAKYFPGMRIENFCDICERQFKTRTGLSNHLAVHFSSQARQRFTCQTCGVIFPTIPRLIRHKYTHAEEKNHFCEICKRVFKSFERKRAHYLVYHGPYMKRSQNLLKCYRDKKGKVSCGVCGGIFKSLITLKKHLFIHAQVAEDARKKKEIVEGIVPNLEETNSLDVQMAVADIKEEPKSRPTTPEDGNLTDKPTKLSDSDLNDSSMWIEKPEKAKPHECPVCKETFSNLSKCRNHISSHDTTKKTYSCDMCKKVFYRSLALYKHRLAHDKDGLFPCDICGKKFGSKENLNRHAKIHLLIKPHVCSVCGKGFTELKNLQIHMICHTKEKAFECPTCGKNFRTGKQFREHTRVHTGERPYKCKLCNKGFRSLDVLRNHLKTHSDSKSFMCHLCGKVFRQRSSLITHKKSHLAEPSHKCKICGKGCRSSGSLKSHYVSYHLDHKDLDNFDLKVYKCEICFKLFGEKQDCDRHMRVHTGEKPFVCDYCGKAFSDKSNMRSHKKIHTDDRPYVCDLCGKAFIFNRDLKKHKLSHERDTLRVFKPKQRSRIKPKVIAPQVLTQPGIKLEPNLDLQSSSSCSSVFQPTSAFSASHPALLAAISGAAPNPDVLPPIKRIFLPNDLIAQPMPAIGNITCTDNTPGVTMTLNQSVGALQTSTAPVNVITQPIFSNINTGGSRLVIVPANTANNVPFTLFTPENLM